MFASLVLLASSLAAAQFPREIGRVVSGSGALISPDGYVLTCHHCVSGVYKVQFKLGPKTYDARVVDVMHSRDLALLKIEGNNLPYLPVEMRKTTAAGEKRLGMDVKAVGYPLPSVLGQNVKVTSGTVSGVMQYRALGYGWSQICMLDVTINGGNSGGALVDTSGNLVGITNMSFTGDKTMPVSFAIPVEEARVLLEANKVKVKAPAVKKLSNAQLVQRVAPAVGQVIGQSCLRMDFPAIRGRGSIVSISPDGSEIAVGQDRALYLWTQKTYLGSRVLSLPGYVWGSAFLDGGQIAILYRTEPLDMKLRVVRIEDFSTVRENLIASGFGDLRLDRISGRLLGVRIGGPEESSAKYFVYDPSTGDAKRLAAASDGEFSDAAVSPSGDLFASLERTPDLTEENALRDANRDALTHRILLRRVDNGEQVRATSFARMPKDAPLALSSDGKRIASTYPNTQSDAVSGWQDVRLANADTGWQLPNGPHYWSMGFPGMACLAMRLFEGSSRLVVREPSGLLAFDTKKYTVLLSLRDDKVAGFDLSQDGKWLVTGSYSGAVKLYRLR